MRNDKPMVIFDFDGVLADSFDVWYQVVKEAFAVVGVDLTPQQYRDFYLTNVKEGQRLLLADEHKFAIVQKSIRENIRDAYKKTKLFGFAKELVLNTRSLANLTIVSSSPSEVILAKLAESSLAEQFALVLGADQEVTKKGKFQKVLHDLPTAQGECFFVSDTVGDIREGKEFGLKTSAVTWGFHSRELLEQAQPDLIFDSFQELIQYLRG